MFKIFFICMCVLCLLSCRNEKLSDCARAIDAVTNRFTEEMKRNEHFVLSSSGGKNSKTTVEIITLGYDTGKKLDVREGRILLVKCVSKLLEELNASKELRPYLDHYPFSAKGIRFSIHSYDQKREKFGDGALAYVLLSYLGQSQKTVVHYRTYDPITDDYITCHQESYEEAEKIVRSEENLER